MKKSSLALILAILILLINSCSETTKPSGMAKVGIKGVLAKNSVRITQKSNNSINVLTVDSLTITRVRILISDLKIKLNDQYYTIEDEDKYDDQYQKSGPFVLDATYPLSKNIIDTLLPTGRIKEIEFEIHRLDDSKLSIYAAYPKFAPFATSERYSVIIEGKLKSGGVETSFTYNSKVEGDVSLEYEKDTEIKSDRDAVLKVVIDPTIIFKKGTDILDPRDASNSSYIDNQIKTALESDFED